MERRRFKRYQLQADVLFNWTDSTGVSHQGSGQTLDISSTGVFVISGQSAPPLHSTIALDVRLPTKRDLHLKADGEVVRVQQGPAYAGFAAATDFQLGEEKYIIPVQ